jgi:hypothetical protein
LKLKSLKKVLWKTVLVHKYAGLHRSSIHGQMVNKLSYNLLSLSFLLFVISNIKYADSDMYDVENKTKFSILIIPVYWIYREIQNESFWETKKFRF